MNDAHLVALASVGQVVLLAVSAILIFWYLIETRKMRQAAERQVEASFRPALIVTHDGVMDHNPRVENIGSGPAMEVSWSLQGSDLAGKFPFIRPAQPQYLPYCETKELYNAAAKTGPANKLMPAVITCRYKSLSGREHESISSGNLETLQFTTSFSE